MNEFTREGKVDSNMFIIIVDKGIILFGNLKILQFEKRSEIHEEDRVLF